MSEVGFSLYLRVFLIIVGAVVFLINSGALIYFWKKLDVGQRLFVLGCLFMQLFVLDELREFIGQETEWRWRLVLLFFGFTCFLTDILFPFRRRKESTERVLEELRQDK